MGWAYIGEDKWGREAGYGIEATCDKRGCDEVINRGLGCVCGTDDLDDTRRPMHGASAGGCGRYFCDAHGGGWSVGPRGGCPHRGKKAWGKTKCQLLSNDRHETAYFCACHEWSYEGEPLPKPDWRKVAEDPLLEDPSRVPGFMEHVKERGFASEMGRDEPETFTPEEEAQIAAVLERA